MSPVEDALREREPLAAILIEALRAMAAGGDERAMLATLAARTRTHVAADDVGVLLAGRRGELDIAVATSTDTQVLELMQVRTGDGPCVHAHLTGESVLVGDAADLRERWPAWTSEAVHRGYHSVLAAPLRHQDANVGALNVLARRPCAFTAADLQAIEVIADLASIAMAGERQRREAARLADQLSHALDSRVVIEQAKGYLAAQRGVGPGEAFALIRRYSRNHNLQLRAVAQGVIDGSIRP